MRTAVFELEEGPVHYADYGGEGEPLVVIHGVGGSHLNCSRLAPELTDRFHVYAPDLIGFGRTPLAGRDASMASNQVMIDGFIAHVSGAPATVVGHSMGGVLGMQLAAGDPHAVSRLVLISPSVGPLRSPAARVSTSLLNLMSRRPRVFGPLMRLAVRRDVKRLVHATLRKYVRDLDDYDPFLVEAHVDLERERSGQKGAYLGYLQAWHSMAEEAGNIDEFMKAVVSLVETPTLVIQGEQDRIVPADFIHRVHGLRPDWGFVELPNMGHAPHMERPERIADIILEWAGRATSVATPR